MIRAAEQMDNWRRQFSVSSNQTAKAASLWRDFVNEVYYPIEVSNIRKTEFAGNLDEISLGDVQITKFTAEEQEVERTSFHTKFDRSEDFILIIPQRGELSYRQFGREGRSPPRCATLILCSEPYWAACTNDYSNLTIRIPAQRIRERIGKSETLCGRTFSREQLLSVAISGLVSGLFENSADIGSPDKELFSRCGDAIVDLVLLALERELGPGEAGGTGRSQIYRRILGYLRENLADPNLSPQAVAQANGISVSYMHKIFRTFGQSVTKVIQDDRLSLAHESLVKPALRHLSIGQIAFGAGFNNQAHFTSCFRAKYGETPREVRRSALTELDRAR